MAMRSMLSRVSVSVAGRMEWTPGASRFSKVASGPVYWDPPAEHDNILKRVKDCLEEVKREIEKKAKKEKENADKKSGGPITAEMFKITLADNFLLWTYDEE